MTLGRIVALRVVTGDHGPIEKSSLPAHVALLVRQRRRGRALLPHLLIPAS